MNILRFMEDGNEQRTDTKLRLSPLHLHILQEFSN